MAVLDVVLYPDDPLTLAAAPVDIVDAEIQRLASDMFETMTAHDGVGLAGPQVNVPKRIIIVHEPEGEPMCLINPEIVASDGRQEGEEGCLSLPRVYAMVPRAEHIHVRALNEQGRPVEFDAEALLSRIVQHEIDHLNGIIFLDRVDILTRQAKLAEWDEVRTKLTASADPR